jgi:hypothetical protein
MGSKNNLSSVGTKESSQAMPTAGKHVSAWQMIQNPHKVPSGRKKLPSTFYFELMLSRIIKRYLSGVESLCFQKF